VAQLKLWEKHFSRDPCRNYKHSPLTTCYCVNCIVMYSAALQWGRRRIYLGLLAFSFQVNRVIFSAGTSTHRTTLLQPCVDFSWDSVLSFPQRMHFHHLNTLPDLMWTNCCKAPYHNLPAAEPRFLQESSG
jgi:hypothetical protein